MFMHMIEKLLNIVNPNYKNNGKNIINLMINHLILSKGYLNLSRKIKV